MKKNNNYITYIAGALVALLLLAEGAYLCWKYIFPPPPPPPPPPPKTITIEFILPKDTTLFIDDKIVENNRADLKKGLYRLELKHPFLLFKYDSDLNVYAPKRIALVTEAQLRPEKKIEVGQAYETVLNDIFQQAIVKDKMTLDDSRYVVEEKNLRDNMTANHKEVREFMQAKNIKGMRAEKVVLPEGALAVMHKNDSYFVEGKLVIKCKTENESFNVPMDASFKIIGDKLKLAELRKFHFFTKLKEKG